MKYKLGQVFHLLNEKHHTYEVFDERTQKKKYERFYAQEDKIKLIEVNPWFAETKPSHRFEVIGAEHYRLLLSERVLEKNFQLHVVDTFKNLANQDLEDEI